MKKVAFIFLFIFYVFVGKSQESMVDSAITIPYVGISYGFHQPRGDLKARFGTIQSIGGQFGVKLKSNISLIFKADYLFGQNVREIDVLSNLRTTEGGIIEVGGQLTDPILDMQGYDLSLMIGYTIPLIGPNPNSGLLISVGPTFMQHRIEIDYRDASIPQLEGDYLKGYDRLTNGFGLNEFIGYIHYGRKKLVNFYAGFDFMQVWTKNRRGFNYNEGLPDTETRRDNTAGFRIGWILTLYQRAPQQFYYR